MIAQAITATVSRWPLPPELLTFFLSMLPIIEMRGAIPVGHGIFGLTWFSAFAWSYVGSLMPGVVIMLLAEPVIGWCNRKSPFCNRLIGRTLERTRTHFAKKHERFGDLFLLILVALPFPGTGVWSGALAAIVFGVPRHRAIRLMVLGNLAACIIVTLAAMGLFKAASLV